MNITTERDRLLGLAEACAYAAEGYEHLVGSLYSVLESLWKARTALAKR